MLEAHYGALRGAFLKLKLQWRHRARHELSTEPVVRRLDGLVCGVNYYSSYLQLENEAQCFGVI